MSKKWTEDRISECIRILQDSPSVGDAIIRINEGDIFDSNVTASAMRKAFSRHGHGSPSTYTYSYGGPEEENEKCDTGDTDDIDESVFDLGGEFDWDIVHGKEHYLCKKGDKEERVPFEIVEDIVILYCSEFPGQGKTKQELVDYLSTKVDLNLSLCADKDAWGAFFDKYNISKAMMPAAPHLDGEDNEEVIKYVYERGDTLRKKLVKDKFNKVRHLERALEKQYKKHLEFREIYQLAEGADLDRQAVYKMGHEVLDEQSQLDAGRTIHHSFMADLHAGKHEMAKRFRNTGNEFNSEIFRDRVKVATELQVEALFEHADQLDEIFMWNLGDNFEAFLENMREGQHFGMYGTPKQTYDDVIWANSYFIDRHIGGAPKDTDMTFVMIGGNHDRFMEDKSPSSEEFMVHIIAEHLRSIFAEYDNVNIVEGAPVTSIMMSNGTNVIAMHGHKKSVRKSNIENAINVHGYDYADRYLVVQGHLHRFESFPTKSDKGMAMIVPSWVGGDAFITDQTFKNSKAKAVSVKGTEYEDQFMGPYDIEDRSVSNIVSENS